ncbi:VOC family protein [Streptomyces mutabilis]|uniref:VOC family protein n=1 Tax=Streptomyces mutabilis TaxID=67332 RepID=UPI0033BF0617
MIRSLAYLGVTTPAIEEWRSFGPEVLGLDMADGPDGGLRFKMDEAQWRLALQPGERDGVDYVGWSVIGEAEAREIAKKVTAYGIEVHDGDAELCEARATTGLLWFEDPFGIRQELSWGRLIVQSSFRPGRAMSGFKTGEQGMGHVVFMVPDIKKADEFYSEVMGFKLSDLIIQGPLNARFYHINGRHHSLAVAEVPGVVGFQHLMLEVNSLDDVGLALDECERREVPITMTLGRHVNDLMTSFYLESPSAFHIEYGYGGLTVDNLWEPKKFDRMSIWGHHRGQAPDAGPGLIISAETPAGA